ncbi:MAG: arsenite methyltransferase [Bacteroidales bacterium]|nr:arsenite methyltransferase [Bacteroidales bacterium]
MEEARLKAIVLEKYSAIASAGGCCCESPADVDYSIFSESYDQLKGYNPDADMGLGCGIPTEFAGIKAGDTVLDLGSGAGNDCFVARAETGEKGRVIGLDFSDEMLVKARKNVKKLGLKNVEFVAGDIDNMPLPDAIADVIISNCVLNLVPSKERAFAEMMRVLKNDGHFCVSDVVLIGQLPEALRQDAVLYAGCVSGALQKNDYLAIIEKAGFKNVKIHKEKQVSLPDELLHKYLDKQGFETYKKSESGIFSITVSGSKM